MKHIKRISRRKFIGTASCAGLGYTTFVNSLLNLSAINAAAISNSSTDDYKAMVCILLSGGNDSFNMLMPKSTPIYADYAAARSNLAIPLDEISTINFATPNSANPVDNLHYGLHQAMSGPESVNELFQDSKISFITNIGTLAAVIDKASFQDNSALKPFGLYSHSDQIQQWQTSVLSERTVKGWGGKIADLINDQNGNSQISMNISLSGTNIFQTGNETIEYAITNEGSIGLHGHNNNNLFNEIKTSAVNNMFDHTYQNIFKQTYANTVQSAKANHTYFTDALATFGGFADGMFTDNNPVSQDLKMIAHTIAARQALGCNRQIFFVNFGGWDHHDGLFSNHANMLGILSRAMFEFNAALEDINMQNDVLTFTCSEFGRSLTSNGNGSDHGWGGNVMVMGGTDLINGRQMFGNYPSLDLQGDNVVGRGVVLPTISIDSYFAEIAKWFGVDDCDLNMLFPQLCNFYSICNDTLPIGFLKTPTCSNIICPNNTMCDE